MALKDGHVSVRMRIHLIHLKYDVGFLQFFKLILSLKISIH